MSGQRATLHTVCATSPTPIAEPIAEATGPDMASMKAAAAAMTSPPIVIACTGRSFQTGRPSSIFIDSIHRPPERADVTRRGPDCADHADHQSRTGGGRLHQLFDRGTECVDRGTGAEVCDDLQQRLGRALSLAEDAEQ